MESSYDIMIPRKIPVLRGMGWLFVGGAFVILMLFLFMMSPSKDSNLEMQTAYFIVAIPESVKIALIYSAIILAIGLLILRLTVYYRPGLLTIGDDYMEMITNKLTYRFQIENISRIRMSAGKYVFFFPNISTIVVIVEKGGENYKLLLRHYMQTEEVYTLLSSKGIIMETFRDEF